jgi:hypothetical protein
MAPEKPASRSHRSPCSCSPSWNCPQTPPLRSSFATHSIGSLQMPSPAQPRSARCCWARPLPGTSTTSTTPMSPLAGAQFGTSANGNDTCSARRPGASTVKPRIPAPHPRGLICSGFTMPTGVARIFNLLYRRFPTCMPRQFPTPTALSGAPQNPILRQLAGGEKPGVARWLDDLHLP